MTLPRLTLALPKGRLAQQVAGLFARAGHDLSAAFVDDRRLRVDLPARAGGGAAALTVLSVRPADVATYVEYGAADVGVAGKDVLDEAGRDLYEMLDLGFGACRLVVAAPAAADGTPAPPPPGSLKVATKYPVCTKRHFLARGRPVEVIRLHGSVELAVLCGLADRIVDLVETGETLRRNHLVEEETVLRVTARLVVNRASLKTRRQAIDPLIGQLEEALG